MDRSIENLWNGLTSNLPTKLISILIALVLWVVVLGAGTAEESKEVALEIVTSPDLVVSNEIPERVVFRLSGPKAALRSALKRRYDPIRINLAGSKPGLITHRFFSDQIRLPIGVKVTSVTPNSLIIKTEAVTSKTVPIKIQTRGELPDGLQLNSMEVVPEGVKIIGAESRIQPVSEVSTIPIDLSQLSGSIEQEVALDLIGAGFKTEGSAPRVRFSIEGHGANFKIRNVSIKLVGTLKGKIEPSTVTALVRAAPADLRKLDTTQVYAEVRAPDRKGRRKGTVTETVRVVLPPNVTLVRVIPETVKITLY